MIIPWNTRTMASIIKPEAIHKLIFPFRRLVNGFCFNCLSSG
nr:MAG TPA: Protein of unknown function (DUF1244) [Inoviridae sp.]